MHFSIKIKQVSKISYSEVNFNVCTQSAWFNSLFKVWDLMDFHNNLHNLALLIQISLSTALCNKQ